MAEVKGCNRLSPVLQPGALRLSTASRRSVVTTLFMLIPVLSPFPAGTERRAGRSTVIRPPARVRFAVPRPFALATKTARLRCGLR